MITANNTFTTSLEIEQGLTRTENGALCHSSTLDACLDFFSKGAACRGDLDQAWALFEAAYNEQPELALRILFWVRDVRGGAGERNVFRHVVELLARPKPEVGERLAFLFSGDGRVHELPGLVDNDRLSEVGRVI